MAKKFPLFIPSKDEILVKKRIRCKPTDLLFLAKSSH